MIAPPADPLSVTPLPADTMELRHAGAVTSAPTLLLVEDSATQRRLIHYLLHECGNWNVVQAVDGAAALQSMERSLPDVVLTDVYMPFMDGFGLVEEIRSRFPQIPVVLMTSQGNEQLAVAALKAGAADYVSKQHLPETLSGILERVLKSARDEMTKFRLLRGVNDRITRYELENDPNLISPLVENLRQELLAMGVCDQTGATRTGIALQEAILNAMYHGNLEVSSQLRRDGDEPFHRLAWERRHQDPYRQRRVRVTARITRRKATFVIKDQGPGFGPANLPDPTDPDNLDKPGGRGLLLMRMFMDEVRYNSAGNQITLVKYRTSRDPMSR